MFLYGAAEFGSVVGFERYVCAGGGRKLLVYQRRKRPSWCGTLRDDVDAEALRKVDDIQAGAVVGEGQGSCRLSDREDTGWDAGAEEDEGGGAVVLAGGPEHALGFGEFGVEAGGPLARGWVEDALRVDEMEA